MLIDMRRFFFAWGIDFVEILPLMRNENRKADVKKGKKSVKKT